MTNKTIDKAGAVRPGEELPIAPLVEWINTHIPDLQGTPKVTQYSGGIGVLDWELATLGDPLMDLGNSLAYWDICTLLTASLQQNH